MQPVNIADPAAYFHYWQQFVAKVQIYGLLDLGYKVAVLTLLYKIYVRLGG